MGREVKTWREQGLLLAVRHHGESSAIIEVLTPERGRWVGMVRGGASRKMAPILQVGAELDLTWRARLEEHLGTFAVEPLRSRAALVMADRSALAALQAVTAVLSVSLPERAAHGAVHRRTVALLDMLGDAGLWPLAYLRWELALLEELGFGLDLSACAVTGARDGLEFVSPRTGRAVSRAGAGDWATRLLPLPPVMLGRGDGSRADVARALAVTAVFLSRALGDRSLPAARLRLAETLIRG